MMADVESIDPIADALKAAQAEIAEEFAGAAKRRIMTSLRRIADAEKIVQNLRIQHDGLLEDLRAEARARK